jgi:hypothetical protein
VTEFSEEGCGSKRTVLPVMMMIDDHDHDAFT